MGDWESGVLEAFLVSSDFISNDGETGKLFFILADMAVFRPDTYESEHWGIRDIALTKFKLQMPPELQKESDKLVSKIQQLIPYINSYAKNHAGDLPDELNLLEDYGLDGYELFGGPVWWHKVPYRGKGKNRNLADPSRIIIAEGVVYKRCEFYHWPILFLDGHIETRTKLNLQDFEVGLTEIAKKPDVQVEGIPAPEARTEPSDRRIASVASDYKATLPNGAMVELIGVCEHPSQGKKWWRPDGLLLKEAPYDKIEAPHLEHLLLETSEDQQRVELALRIITPTKNDLDIGWRMESPGFLYYLEEIIKDGQSVPQLKALFAAVSSEDKTIDVKLVINDSWVRFNNVALRPNQKPDVQVEVF